jgi:hypothetical protein
VLFLLQVLNKYIDHVDFEYCEMDMHSAFIALAGHDFLLVIKSHISGVNTLMGSQDIADPVWRSKLIVKITGSRVLAVHPMSTSTGEHAFGLFEIKYTGEASAPRRTLNQEDYRSHQHSSDGSQATTQSQGITQRLFQHWNVLEEKIIQFHQKEDHCEPLSTFCRVLKTHSLPKSCRGHSP